MAVSIGLIFYILLNNYIKFILFQTINIVQLVNQKTVVHSPVIHIRSQQIVMTIVRRRIIMRSTQMVRRRWLVQNGSTILAIA